MRYVPTMEFVESFDRELLCQACADDDISANHVLLIDDPWSSLHGYVNLPLCDNCHFLHMVDVNGGWVHMDGTTLMDTDTTPEVISDMMEDNWEELDAVKYSISAIMVEQY